MDSKLNFRSMNPVGKCSVCGINMWEETEGKPAIWPCGVPNCPFPEKPQKPFERSSTGSSLNQVIYSGS